MESVFWLMWAADVGAGVKVFALTVSVVFGFASFISLVIGSVEQEWEIFNRVSSKWWAVAILVSIAIATPSQQTLHLMAAAKASEVGLSAAANTAIGQKAAVAIESVLDRVISEAGEKK